MISPETHAAMHRHWSFAFLPLPPWRPEDLLWPFVRLGSVFAESGLRYAWPALQVLVAILGAAALLRSRRGCALVLLGPVVMALVAATLHLYPFCGRLVAFVMPAFIIALAAGIERVAVELHERFTLAHAVSRVGLLLPVLGPVLLAPPVYRPEEIRPALAYVAHHRGEGEPVYVYYGAGPAAEYYGPPGGLAGANVMIGDAARRGDSRTQFRELDRFRGQRGLWVVIAHERAPERIAIVAYLSRIGAVRDSFVVAARLLRLSNPRCRGVPL